MGMPENLALAIEKANRIFDLVNGKFTEWNTAVQNKIQELESWRQTLFSENAGVNLYKNSRFMELNEDGTHPLGFSHFYSHGSPQYSMITPDFGATSGDEKIAADLVSLVGARSWYNTPFKVLKVVCNGTRDIENGRHWSLNQNVYKARGPLTRGCYVYMKPTSVTSTDITYSIRDCPSGASSEEKNVTNQPILLIGRGNADGNYLGFNLNVYLNEIDSSETVEFFIVAPFYVEGYVDGYRTSTIDIDKV